MSCIVACNRQARDTSAIAVKSCHSADYLQILIISRQMNAVPTRCCIQYV